MRELANKKEEITKLTNMYTVHNPYVHIYTYMWNIIYTFTYNTNLHTHIMIDYIHIDFCLQ